MRLRPWIRLGAQSGDEQALLTFEALVAGAKEATNKDVILTHASACIFAPQPTGYSPEGAADNPSAKSIVEVFSKQAGG